jgi:uncharacterized protein YqjF (DUF2071 family)
VPYFHAEIDAEWHDERMHFASERRQADGPPAAFEAEYGPTGEIYNAAPGSLDHWLAERYCLYTVDEDQRVHRGEIHHPPWPLQPASAAIARNTMAAPVGIDLTGDPVCHYADRQDVVFWPLAPLDRG